MAGGLDAANPAFVREYNKLDDTKKNAYSIFHRVQGDKEFMGNVNS